MSNHYTKIISRYYIGIFLDLCFKSSPCCHLIGSHRGQHHVGSMVALLAVEVASVARVTCPVLGRDVCAVFW